MILAAVAALVVGRFPPATAIQYIVLGALGGLALVLKEQLFSIAALAVVFVGQTLITNRFEAENTRVPDLIWEPLALTFGTMAAALLLGSYFSERRLKRGAGDASTSR